MSRFPFREGKRDGRGYRSAFKFTVVVRTGDRKLKANDVTKNDVTNWGGAMRWAKEKYGDTYETILTGHYASAFNSASPQGQNEIIKQTGFKYE